MKKIKNYFFLIFSVSFATFYPKATHAVIPPDFIFNIGTQIVQFFSLIMIFFAAVFSTFFQFFKSRFYTLKHKYFILFSTLIFLIVAALSASYYYATFRQKLEYKKWLAESNAYGTPQKTSNQSYNEPEIISTTTQINTAADASTTLTKAAELSNPAIETTDAKSDSNDQLDIGGTGAKADLSSSKYISKISQTDSNANFISAYYGDIANGRLIEAYELSKKSVAFNVFASWYKGTTKIILDKFTRIDEKKSSIELTLYEENSYTSYGVLITLLLKNNKPVKIESSDVKILAKGEIKNDRIISDKNIISQEYDFYDKNSTVSLEISNASFKKTIDANADNYMVLDAREDIEFENGYFPGSTHIRFADLKAGRWIELPQDKYIYVICWSGIRGKEVTEFLRTKKIVASYLEKGASGWVDFGGKWIGNIKFAEKYMDAKYQIIFKTADVKKMVANGVVLVDTREPYRYKQSHIAGSLNIPLMYTSTINLETTFNQVPKNSQVVTVCDGYVNCFDAKLTGVELERRGNKFIGRYNKPWEYAR